MERTAIVEECLHIAHGQSPALLRAMGNYVSHFSSRTTPFTTFNWWNGAGKFTGVQTRLTQFHANLAAAEFGLSFDLDHYLEAAARLEADIAANLADADETDSLAQILANYQGQIHDGMHLFGEPRESSLHIEHHDLMSATYVMSLRELIQERVAFFDQKLVSRNDLAEAADTAYQKIVKEHSSTSGRPTIRIIVFG